MEEKSQRVERLGQLQETQRTPEAAVVPRMLAWRVRYGLQLQLKRKEQINRMLRKGLIRTRKQLHLKKIRLKKCKLVSEKMKKEMEEQLENKNETIVDLHIQVQWLKKDVEQFAVKERTLQSEKEELANEITAINTSLQNQLLENTLLTNQATELQQQLELKDQTISYLVAYRQNLEDEFVTIHEKLDLLDQEMDQMVHERNLILHYVVTMQACLYDNVEQWLHQQLEDGRITENSVHKFKTTQEQINLMKPIFTRECAVLEEKEQEVGEEEGEDEEEEYEDEEDEEEEGDDEEEGEEEEEEEENAGEDWETTESEEVEEERPQKGGKVVEEEIKETTEGKEAEEWEKQSEVEEEEKVQENKEGTTDNEDLYKFRLKTDQSTSTDARHKNIFEDTSESESHHADSSSSGLSSGSTSSTTKNTSDLDSNGSTSTKSAENSKIPKKNKLKSWLKKMFRLKATRKPAASESEPRGNGKASDPSVRP